MSASFRLILAASASLTGVASAATLHQPLPLNSLERNGAPQPMTSHTSHITPPPALPQTGLHPNAQAGIKKHYGGTPIDVTLYHYDNNRTDWNPTETDLTPATVGSSSFGQLTTLNVDGNVFAQPLLVTGFTLPDGTTHDILIIATGHNSVYAFDAQTYTQLWQVNLGKSQKSGDVGCGDVKPEYGISSTPIIVRNGNTATIYLTAATEPAAFSFHTQLHALNLADGSDVLTPVEIAPSAKIKKGTVTFDPQNQWNRASLAYNNGFIYMGIGSHCDNNAGAIGGWLLRYDTNLNLQTAFHTIDKSASYELDSIWMAGFAPSIDSNGNVYVVTGNGAFNKGKKPDFGETVLSLSPTLEAVNSYFTPTNYGQLNNNDTDFGSGGVMLLPTVTGQTAPPMAAAIGKDAVLYLLHQTSLGGEKVRNKGELQAVRIGGSGNGTWGGPAYYLSPNGGRVFAQITGDVLRGYSVSTGVAPSLTAYATGNSNAGYGGSFPLVSTNGSTDGTAVVWLIRRGDTVQLEAYDANTLGTPLFQANAGTWSNQGQANSFLSLMEANGRVYVPAYKTVTVFGLTQ
jgi:hypothetical protein